MPDDQKTPVDSSFPLMEEEVLQFWDKADTFNQSLKKEAPHGDYVFYDGPPFATGTPHYGHIVASIMKDVVPRYQTMRGYRVERKWGWDCHGLPIENIVEKQLGTKSKKDIEELGVAKFNNLCREQVLTYVDDWKKVIRRLGRWADMENAYKTMDLEFMDSIWWAFKQLWDKDLIYQDYRSMYICPRCETTLAQSEVSEGYRDIKDLSVTVKFELTDEPGTFILAWTTTPWTLIGNVALAVGGEIKYVKVEDWDMKAATEPLGVDTPESNIKKVRYIVAKDRYEFIKDQFKSPKILETIDGDNLIGRPYRPVFDYYYNDKSLANHANGWKIYTANFVTTTEGTGVVHIAPAFGEDDMNLGRAQKLPFIQHVGMDGVFKPEVKDFAGLHVKPLGDHTTTDVEIIRYLAAHGTLFSKAKYEHSYPHCWRCDTPLINYATSSLFIAVTKIKDQLIKNATAINWSPDYIKEGRFGNWLEGARDWSISRQRFWASAIPIWECACGARQVIGSVAELESLTGQPITDIHKDKVDLLAFKCVKCGGTMKRISDVLDCWFESGSMPFAQLHYPAANKEKFEKNFPAQFIAEGIDQTRTWFYYLHVVAGGIFQRPAYQNVIVNGIVLAEDGKKMSKRLHNYPDPLVVMEKYGSDALRAYLVASPVMAAENLNFSEKGVQESLRKNIMILWNVYKFYEMFAPELKATKAVKGIEHSNVLDQWILAKLDQLVKEVTEAMEAYNLPKAMRPLTEFIDELSTWYLRRSRDRFKAADEIDKYQALITTRMVLIQLAKLMAPFTPFIAENLWQRVSGCNFRDPNRSVHLEKWPEETETKSRFKKLFFKKSANNRQIILEKMVVVRHLVEMGLAKRDAAGIKIRQMLSKLTVTGKIDLGEEYVNLIKDELNIQVVIFIPSDDDKLSVELDTAITPALKQEGIKRELIRSINLWRKDNNLNINDRVAVYYETSAELGAVITGLKAEIIKDTLLSDLISGPVTGADKKEVKIDGQLVNFCLKSN
jgi:isoleucyl-tRNA synthetase